jgi:hypothetical protein
MHGDALRIPEGQAQLFLDDESLAETHGVTRVWHPLRKHPRNPLILKSGPEDILFIFGTVVREPDPATGGEPIFRMWYYAAREGLTWVAYATSRDGLSWEKPQLGLIEIAGSRANNAVFCPEGWRVIGLSGVVPDPEAPEDERYKLMIPADKGEDDKAYLRAVSPDGIHWTLRGAFRPAEPCKPDRACFVWDPFREVYALYCRMKYAPPELVERGGPAYWGRAIALCTSNDFENWSAPETVMHAEPDDPDGTEIYGMAAFPYEGRWVGLPQIHRSLPHLGYIDVAIAHSRDGRAWRREKDLVLPRGGVGEWDRFNQCASTRPVRVGDELWIYYSGRLYRHGEYRRRADLTDTGPYHSAIGLATLRLDGWCSMQASFDGGQVVTKPVVLPEGDVFLNAQADWGEVVVEALGAGGEPIQGMQPAPVTGDGVRLAVEWPQGRPLESLAGRPVRLRFNIRNAVLYSWTVE